MSMTIDFTDFDKGFKTLVEKSVPPEIDKALFRAGNELLHDAIYVMPYAPFREGHLRGSARTERPADAPEGTGVLAGFNIVYAARWHELTPAEDSRINWTLPGSGCKYLEMKIPMFRDKYIRIIGDYLGKLLGGK
jgi:hypothetical protein